MTKIECREKECIHRNADGICTLTEIVLLDDGSRDLGRMYCKDAKRVK